MIAYHRTHNIHTASYGGLTPIIPSRLPENVSEPSVNTARVELLKVLHALADARGATEGQILFKWLQAEDVIVATTSTREDRLKECLASESLPDLTESERNLIRDAVGDAHFRAFVRAILLST